MKFYDVVWSGKCSLARRAALIGAFLILSGCASNSSVLTAATCTVPDANTSDYLIGPGDNLEIVVWRNDELSAVVPVRPDGKISTPLIDDMQASGKRPSALARDMEAVLGEYLRTPQVSVMVTGQGAANQIQVVGEVLAPQALSYRAGLKVLDVIVAAGGLSEFAAGNRSRLIRQTGQGQVECRLRIKDLMSGEMAENIDIYPGDVLVIPETRF
jgi:polysaccharide export outer membrane protein